MNKKIIIIFLLFHIFLIYSTEVNIKTLDKDLGIPLEGVKIIINNNNEQPFYTNNKGYIKINLEDDIEKINIIATLIGYDIKKIFVTDLTKEITLEMTIQSILEGKEILIEEDKATKNEELGISKVIDKDRLKSTAMSGFAHDVMSAIKTLPGVSYGGGRGLNNLSIRGGDTDGLTTLLDGFIVRYPYQWNGMYSIFSPHVVDSVKFSSGVFSAKQGLATSAIMEVNSIVPDEGLKVAAMLSLADSELYIQTPLWKNSGLLIGGRFIYYDLINLMMGSAASGIGSSLNLNEQYLRDGYFKWFWKITDRVEWYLNGFFGCDGATMNSDRNIDKSSEIVNKFKMDYYNYDTFWNMGFKIYPIDNIFIHFFAGYEYLTKGYSGSMGYEGTQEYSDDFKDYYQILRTINPSLPDISGEDNFSIDTDSWMKSETTLHSLQTRGDTDITLHEKIILSIGTGGIFDFNTSSASGEMWQTIWEDGKPVYKKVDFSSDTEDKQILKTFIYFNFNFNIIPDTLKIETGCRIDHNLLFGPGYKINTYPVPGPRFNITYTPIKNLPFLKSLSFSMGSGLFSKSADFSNITEEMGLNDFDVSIPQTLTNVVGTELDFPINLKFKIEGYYKYIFNRFYINTDNSKENSEFLIHTNGIGHAAGFDLTLEKSLSRWIDGSITYSFIYTRLLNPSTDDLDEDENMSGEPTGSWFYPSYHKFHNFNIVLNIKPTQWCTITPKFLLSSGAPKEETTTEQSYAILEDGQVAEMYTSKSEYNDTLRDDLNIQFDLKVSFSSFLPKTKVQWEVFISVENLFVFLYSPSRDRAVNLFTGEDQTSSSVNYGSQVPIPNIGFKITF